MVLVDSSVWIGFLRGDEADVVAVSELIREHNRAVICGPVMQEVLQGIGLREERSRTAIFLSRLPFLDVQKDHFTRAADTYAALRKRGVTIPSIDVLIAVLAVAGNHAVLTRDRHFREIGKELSLKILSPSA